MAAVLEEEFSLGSRLVGGARGELSVWYEGAKACEKTYNGFPTDEEMLDRVRVLLESRTPR